MEWFGVSIAADSADSADRRNRPTARLSALTRIDPGLPTDFHPTIPLIVALCPADPRLCAGAEAVPVSWRLRAVRAAAFAPAACRHDRSGCDVDGVAAASGDNRRGERLGN